jgi:hypothetical protein
MKTPGYPHVRSVNIEKNKKPPLMTPSKNFKKTKRTFSKEVLPPNLPLFYFPRVS